MIKLLFWWKRNRLYCYAFAINTLVGTFLYEHEPHGWIRALSLGASGVIVFKVLDIVLG